MSESTIEFLFFGFMGVLVHTLMKINAINERMEGNINLRLFFKIKWASILISVSVVIVAVFARNEIAQLRMAGNWLALGMFSIGLSAQSLAYFLVGKSERVFKKILSEDDQKEVFGGTGETNPQNIGAGQVGLPKDPPPPTKLVPGRP